ncbi:DUF7424 family protein [Leptospira perolatii]|nr:hypothetical protein [Leptospira perolatii]
MLFAVLTLVALATLLCKYSITGEIFVSDILDIASSKSNKTVYANSSLKFGVSSQEQCEEDKEFLIKTIGQQFKDLKDARCTKQEYENFFEASIKIPMVKLEDKEFKPQPGLLNITVKVADKIKVGLYLSSESFNSLKTAIKEKYWSTINIDEFTLGMNLVNDSKTKLKIEVASVYMDNKPFPKLEAVDIEPKSKVSLRLSNVLRDAVYENGKGDFLQLAKQ